MRATPTLLTSIGACDTTQGNMDVRPDVASADGVRLTSVNSVAAGHVGIAHGAGFTADAEL